MDQKIAMGLREAGETVGLSHWTLRKLIAEGKLPALRVGRRVLVEPDSLRQLIENARQTPQGKPQRVSPVPIRLNGNS